MTVMGVLSSCPASVMNCFCRWTDCTTGSMARRLSRTTIRYTSATHTAMAATLTPASRYRERTSFRQSRNTAIQRFSPVRTTRNR